MKLVIGVSTSICGHLPLNVNKINFYLFFSFSLKILKCQWLSDKSEIGHLKEEKYRFPPASLTFIVTGRKENPQPKVCGWNLIYLESPSNPSHSGSVFIWQKGSSGYFRTPKRHGSCAKMFYLHLELKYQLVYLFFFCLNRHVKRILCPNKLSREISSSVITSENWSLWDVS